MALCNVTCSHGSIDGSFLFTFLLEKILQQLCVCPCQCLKTLSKLHLTHNTSIHLLGVVGHQVYIQCALEETLY